MSDILMSFEELKGIIADYTQIGFMEAVRAYEPAQDLIRQSAVEKWLKMMRVDLKKFVALSESGAIKARRIGKSKNSPLYYSKKEIMEAMKAANVSSILTNNVIHSKAQAV